MASKLYGAQRALGYHNIVYNIKNGKFFIPMPGDNYYEVDVQTGGGTEGGGATQTTATLPLSNPTREGRSLKVDSSNLKTQADLNAYFDKYIQEVEASVGNGGSGTVDQLPPLE